MEKLRISTTQNVDIDYQLASIGDRIFAHLLDGFIKISYGLILLWIAVDVVSDFTWPFYLAYLPIVFYNLLCDAFLNGQTFGKMILKIKVVMSDGSELTFGACFVRWVFRLVDFQITTGLGAFITILANGKGQRIGDLAARTTVLKINPKGNLDRSAYVEVEDHYQPRYHQVQRLSEADLQTVKEVVLRTSGKNNYSEIGAPHPMALHTKKVIMERLNIETEQAASDFLLTLLKDYNYYNK